ncbi:N-terminal phage integrase SAM-like domain-containing protein [Mycetocola zhujimingii]|uniref:N-terminal phage integrase SAM-like domain-containing protein n=1 Tax=Mycetocola zhujimingii TaxID=2079792 RepID=UPI001F1E8D31|nr:N-terminal phage integrase SAM-like domain-containing protein [Mycetocola zhujimingii]
MTYWLEDIDSEGRISRTTRNLYERNMRTLVSPVFDHLALREIGVARCDKFIKRLAKISYSRAKQARVVLRLALELAVRHEVLPRTPMDHIGRLHREPHIPDALTAPEVNVIRAAIARWEAGAEHVSGPKPDGQLGARRGDARHLGSDRRGAGHPAPRCRRRQCRAIHPTRRHNH